MSVDWASLNRVLDDGIITAGIAVMIVRQFRWRSTELRRMLRLPVMIIAAGIGYLVVDIAGGFRWVPGDWIVVGELLLVAVTGTVMGHVTRFRIHGADLQYRLSPVGGWLWALFVVIRVGSFFLAALVGANLADATGLILLSFGVNRLASVLVVRRRADAMPTNHPAPRVTVRGR